MSTVLIHVLLLRVTKTEHLPVYLGKHSRQHLTDKADCNMDPWIDTYWLLGLRDQDREILPNLLLLKQTAADHCIMRIAVQDVNKGQAVQMSHFVMAQTVKFIA